IGPLAATGVSGWAHVVVAPPNLRQFRSTGPEIQFKMVSIAASLETTGTVRPARKITPEEIERVRIGRTAAIFVYGEVQYSDASQTYTTTFRYRYRGNGGPFPSDRVLHLDKADSGNSQK